jgi:hypothetical protein
VQFRQAFATVPINPFSNGPRADAYGLRDGLRRLPALDLQYNPLSNPFLRLFLTNSPSRKGTR